MSRTTETLDESQNNVRYASLAYVTNEGSPSLRRTIRPNEIIDFLSDYRVAVDNYMAVLPGHMYGHSFAHIVRSSLTLSHQIDDLRRNMMITMLREGLNPHAEIIRTGVNSRPGGAQRMITELDSVLVTPTSSYGYASPSSNAFHTAVTSFRENTLSPSLLRPRAPTMGIRLVSSCRIDNNTLISPTAGSFLNESTGEITFPQATRSCCCPSQVRTSATCRAVEHPDPYLGMSMITPIRTPTNSSGGFRDEMSPPNQVVQSTPIVSDGRHRPPPYDSITARTNNDEIFDFIRIPRNIVDE